MNLQFTAQTTTDGVVDRSFTADGVPGVLWSPPDPAPGTPLLLMGHGGGLHKRHPGVVARARAVVLRDGFHVASIDAPGHGDRVRSAEDQEQVAALGRARRARESLDPILAPFNDSLAERAVPEWRTTIDALLDRPGFGPQTPIGYAGMTVGGVIGLRLVVAEPRVRAAVLGGFFRYDAFLDSARRVTVPVEQLLPWDDPELDRGFGLEFFDALGSGEKTLLAFPGTHKRIPGGRLETGFFLRHLGGAPNVS